MGLHVVCPWVRVQRDAVRRTLAAREVSWPLPGPAQCGGSAVQQHFMPDTAFWQELPLAAEKAAGVTQTHRNQEPFVQRPLHPLPRRGHQLTPLP